MLCDYCGEEEGIKEIMNPNMDELDEHPRWNVCGTCEEVIEVQKKLTLAQMVSDEKYGEKIISECNEKLAEIAKRSGKTIMSGGLYKQPDGHYEPIEIIFKGDGNK